MDFNLIDNLVNRRITNPNLSSTIHMCVLAIHLNNYYETGNYAIDNMIRFYILTSITESLLIMLLMIRFHPP